MPATRPFALAMMVALAASCGSRSEDKEQTGAVRLACPERAAALRSALLDEYQGPTSFDPLPRVVGGRPFGDGPIVSLAIRPAEAAGEPVLLVDGRMTAIDDKAVPRRIETTIDAFETRERRPPAVHLSAAPDIPVAAIDRVIAAVPVRVPLRLVVIDAEHPLTADPLAGIASAPGAGEWSKAWLDKLRQLRGDPMAARNHLTEGIRRAGGTACSKPFAAAFSAVGDSHPADARAALADQISAAMEQCRCEGVDPAFETILVAMHRPGGAPIRWLDLPRTLPAGTKTANDVARALAAP